MQVSLLDGVERIVTGFSSKKTLVFIYATLYEDPDATLDDLREAVTIFEEIEPTARRVLGGAHPTTAGIETALKNSRAALRARETPSGNA